MAEALRISGGSSGSLIGYLKGLGLLRVVARQADSAARACWREGTLELHSALDSAGLVEFLLERWVPAPVVSPWNGGSGFFPKDNVAAFTAVEQNDSPRLAPFRAAIAASRAALARAGLTEKPEPRVAKPALLRELRATLADDGVEWLDAAIIMVGAGIGFPPLLGSGGNDGRYDVANNYAQAVAFALSLGGDERGRQNAASALQVGLWQAPGSLRKMSLGHLWRDASPVNSPAGEADSLGNPWDLALAVEGTLLFSAGAGRRLAAGAVPGLAAPFTLRATGAGYGSAVAGETGKAELWLPLWTAPAALGEVETLFREARAQVGRRVARTGLDAARAAGELGVARGIDSFARFSILERAGLSNLAVPAGRIQVRARPAAQALRTLDPWLGRLVGYAAGDIPQSQRETIRWLEHTAFAAAEQGSADDVRDLLGALGRVEASLASADERHRPAGLGPISPRARPWLEALDWSSLEVRLAVVLASVSEPGSRALTSPGRLPALRDYLHGTGSNERGRRSYGEQTVGRVPALAPVVERLAGAHERRHQDAERAELDTLGYPSGIGAALGDLSRLVSHEVDELALGRLIDGLVLLDYREAVVPRDEPIPASVDPVLGLLALAFHDPRAGSKVADERRAACRPRADWVARLHSGRVGTVVAEALLRLRLAEMAPIPDAEDLQIALADGPRLAAALLARPRPGDLRRVGFSLTLASSHQTEEEK